MPLRLSLLNNVWHWRYTSSTSPHSAKTINKLLFSWTVQLIQCANKVPYLLVLKCLVLSMFGAKLNRPDTSSSKNINVLLLAMPRLKVTVGSRHLNNNNNHNRLRHFFHFKCQNPRLWQKRKMVLDSSLCNTSLGFELGTDPVT